MKDDSRETERSPAGRQAQVLGLRGQRGREGRKARAVGRSEEGRTTVGRQGQRRGFASYEAQTFEEDEDMPEA